MTVTSDPSTSDDPPGNPPSTKEEWRRHLIARRRELTDTAPAGDHDRIDRAIAAAAIDWIDTAGYPRALTVTAYDQFRTEPPVRALIDAVLGRGGRVLRPVTRPNHLDWTDSTATSPATDPGTEPLVGGPETLAEADVLFVPALAVDRAGVRLGRGRGYYDRALAYRREGAPVIAVLYPHEWVDRLPAGPHDVPVDAVLTADGVTQVGSGG